MDRCGIEKCGRPTAVMLPWSPIEHFALCEHHALAWRGSKLRGVLQERAADLDEVDRRMLFKMWATTEAVGKDPHHELRNNPDAVQAAIREIH